MSDDALEYRSRWNALRQLGQQPKLLERLRASETAADAIQELRLQSDAARREVLNVVNELQVAAGDSREPPPAEDVDGIRAFFTSGFQQLQRAYRISIAMSVTMFLAGLVFLAIAAWKAVAHPDQVASTSVVGGIGIVQIVALFYRNPLADIARALAQTQQAKIALTSYLVGMTMLHDSQGAQGPTRRDVRVLVDLTSRAIEQLRAYAPTPAKVGAEKASGHKEASPPNGG